MTEKKNKFDFGSKEQKIKYINEINSKNNYAVVAQLVEQLHGKLFAHSGGNA